MLAATLLFTAAEDAGAQTQNYFGSSGALTGNVWSTNPSGPYTSALVTAGGAVINFNNPATFMGGSITVAGIRATANATLSSASGTISNFGNGLVPIHVSAGVTLDFGSQSFTSSTTASYRKEGEGTLALAGNTYGGGFTLEAGTVVVRGVNAFGSGGNALRINGGTIAANANRVFTDKYGVGILIGGDFTLGSSVAPAVATANLTFTDAVSLGASTRKITLGGTGVYTLSGAISGSGGLTVAATAAGTLVLAGANTYQGPTVIEGGTVRFAKAAALYGGVAANWNPANFIVQSQATAVFQVGGTGEFSASDVATLYLGTGWQVGASLVLDTGNAVGGKFVQSEPLADPTNQPVALHKDGFGTLTLAADNAFFGPTIIRAGTLQVGNDGDAGDLGFTSGVANSGTLRFQRADEWTVAQSISGTGSVVQAGAGKTILTGAQTYTGATSVSGGALAFEEAASLANGGSLTVSGILGAVLNLNTAGMLVFNSSAAVGITGGSGTIEHAAGTLVVPNAANALTVGAGGYGSYVLSGGSLRPSGTTVFRVGATNATGQGVFTQTGGSLELARHLAIGQSGGTGVATFLGGTVMTSPSHGVLVGESGAGRGTLNVGTLAGGGATILSQSNSIFPGIYVGQGAAGTVNLNQGTVRFSAAGFRKGSAGGTVFLNGGTIEAAAPNLALMEAALPVTVLRGGVVFDTQGQTATVAAALSAGTGHGIFPAGGRLALAGGTGYIGAPLVTIAGGSGSGASAIAEVANGVVTGVVLTNPGQNYTAGDTVTFSFAGGGATAAAPALAYTLTEADVAAHAAGGLTKRGSGTLHLSGGSTFTGPTVVESGTLLVSGSLSGSTVFLAPGTTLAGTGAVRGAVIGPGGRLQPGNGPGTLTVDDALVLDPESVLAFQLNGANQAIGGGVNDLVITSALTLDGVLNITEIGLGSFLSAVPGSRWRLFQFAEGELTDDGLEFGTMPALGGPFEYALEISAAGYVDLVVVPEPATVGTLLGGLGVVLLRRRRTPKRDGKFSQKARSPGDSPDLAPHEQPIIPHNETTARRLFTG